MQIEKSVPAASQSTNAIKESSAEANTGSAVDLSEEDVPLISVAQSKGKRRINSSAKSKDASEGSSTKSSAALPDHKLLKVIKQEK